jgi:hypothetical protein
MNQNHGTLSNMMPSSDWLASQGRFALNITGATSYVACGARAGDLTETLPFSVSLWVRCNSLGNYSFRGMLSRDASKPYAFSIRGSGDRWSLLTDGIEVVSSTAITTGVWHHITWTLRTSERTLFLNGVQNFQSTASYTIPANGDELRIGTDYIPSEMNSDRIINGQMDDIRIYNRVLLPQEIHLLSRRRGIAYEMSPRCWSSSAVQFNRRRRLLIGASS